MSLSHRYRQLAALIESLESDGITVEDAAPVERDGEQSSDSRFRVRLSLELPADATPDGRSIESPDVGERTSLQPVGANVSPSEQRTGSENSQSRDTVDDITQTRNGTSTADAAGTESAGGGDQTATGSRDSDAVPADATAVRAEGGSTDSESTAAADSTAGRTSVGGADSTTTDEDTTACTHPDCDRTFSTERGMKIHRTKAHPLSELVDDEHDRAVHHDPSVLARVYEEHDTFAEMTEALDVDVGAQAVRKQMIRHGIHEPGVGASSDDAAPSEDDADADNADADNADDEDREDPEIVDESNGRTDGERATDGETTTDEERAMDGERDAPHGSNEGPSREAESAPDGNAGESTDDTDAHPVADTTADESKISERLPDLDLPGSLSTADLRTAVEEATTLYDVQRSLDLDRETTRNVLSEYDLLELVSGRAAALRDREELKAEISQRIRRRAT